MQYSKQFARTLRKKERKSAITENVTLEFMVKIVHWIIKNR